MRTTGSICVLCLDNAELLSGLLSERNCCAPSLVEAGPHAGVSLKGLACMASLSISEGYLSLVRAQVWLAGMRLATGSRTQVGGTPSITLTTASVNEGQLPSELTSASASRESWKSKSICGKLGCRVNPGPQIIAILV